MRIIKYLIFLLSVFGIVGCSDNKRSKNKDRESMADYGWSLPQKDSTITATLFDRFSYSHSIHGSVGYDFNVEYDKTAFHVKNYVEYKDPKAVERGMCGGDSAVKTCEFSPLKKGTYEIRIIHEFRGDVTSVITYKIIVN